MDKLKRFMGTQIGPLPMGIWLIIIGGVGVAVFVLPRFFGHGTNQTSGGTGAAGSSTAIDPATGLPYAIQGFNPGGGTVGNSDLSGSQQADAAAFQKLFDELDAIRQELQPPTPHKQPPGAQPPQPIPPGTKPPVQPPGVKPPIGPLPPQQRPPGAKPPVQPPNPRQRPMPPQPIGGQTIHVVHGTGTIVGGDAGDVHPAHMPPGAMPPVRTFTVRSWGATPNHAGASLQSIAQEEYGNSALWQRIYNANRDVIENPNLIYPGTELVIPQL